jgi:hypothetical protein
MNGQPKASVDVDRLVAILMDLPARERFACAVYFATDDAGKAEEEAIRVSGLTAGEFAATRAKVIRTYFQAAPMSFGPLQ